MRIKFYDNENNEYPIIIIKDNGFKQFEKDLDKYKKDDEENGYNWDSYLELLETKDYFIEYISLDYDKEVFF